VVDHRLHRDTGFSRIFPVRELCIFSPDELGLLFGNPDEDWSRESMYVTGLTVVLVLIAIALSSNRVCYQGGPRLP
jgi:hypothetical protein